MCRMKRVFALIMLAFLLAAGPASAAQAAFDLSQLTLEQLQALETQVQERIAALQAGGQETPQLGATSRKSPAKPGEPVRMEMDMYGKYTYTYDITLTAVARQGNQLICTFDVTMGPHSDGVDRETNIWNTDFSLHSPDGLELARSAKNVYPADTEPGVSWSYALYPESSARLSVLFEGIEAGEALLRFEVTNKNQFDDALRSRSAAWFAAGQ